MTVSRSRKRLGDFATPLALAKVLTTHAVTDSDATILDPCYGGCVFLEESLRRLSELGSRSPARQIFGVDINPSVRAHLQPLLRAGARPSQFITDDFLTTRPENFGGKTFAVVLGNPPYVRHHSISDAKKRSAEIALEQHGVHLDGKSSYWAYFVLHSMRFLAPGGTLAMVLPGSFLFANYATYVRRAIADSFASVQMTLITERIFEDAQERAVLIVARGKGKSLERVQVATAELSNYLDVFRRMDEHRNWSVDSFIDGRVRLAQSLVDSSVTRLLDEISASKETSVLSEWATVRIGVVTGANRFLVVSREIAEKWHLAGSCLSSIVSKSTQLSSLTVSKNDLRRLLAAGNRMLLVNTLNVREVPKTVQRYLAWAKRNGASKTFKTRIRNPWYKIDDLDVPDLFLTYMSGNRPRLVVNRSGATCTNSIHRLYVKDGAPRYSGQTLAFSSLCSLYLLSTEIIGRSYGGGVLKLEPSEASRLLIPMEPTARIPSEVFHRADLLLRQGNESRANALADSLILRTRLGLSDREISAIRRSLARLRRYRYGPRHQNHESERRDMRIGPEPARAGAGPRPVASATGSSPSPTGGQAVSGDLC